MKPEQQPTQRHLDGRAIPDSVTCPHCHTEIPLSEALSHQVEERFRLEFEAAARDTEAEYARALAAKDAELEVKLTAVRTEVETAEVEHARVLAAKDAELEAKLTAARIDVEAAAEARAKESVSTELSDLKARTEAQAAELAMAKKNELALLREKRELQDRQEALELEVARKVDEERSTIVASTTERLEQKHRLELREQDLIREQMAKRIEELVAASDQKRPGLQGEALEREIEDILHESFPGDTITPVKSGKQGADVVQRVRSPRGLDCGSLLWESKNHKHWNSAWIEKLKSDQQAEKADVAIIVTSALPDGVQRMAPYGDVWVCDFASAPILAAALRLALVQIGQARVVDSNRTQAMDSLYEYLSGREFQHRIANTVSAALSMKDDLDAERRSTERSLAKREKQIEILLRNSAGMYGELQAILGGALQPVAALEPSAGEDSDDEPLALAS